MLGDEGEVLTVFGGEEDVGRLVVGTIVTVKDGGGGEVATDEGVGGFEEGGDSFGSVATSGCGGTTLAGRGCGVNAGRINGGLGGG